MLHETSFLAVKFHKVNGYVDELIQYYSMIQLEPGPYQVPVQSLTFMVKYS